MSFYPSIRMRGEHGIMIAFKQIMFNFSFAQNDQHPSGHLDGRLSVF